MTEAREQWLSHHTKEGHERGSFKNNQGTHEGRNSTLLLRRQFGPRIRIIG